MSEIVGALDRNYHKYLSGSVDDAYRAIRDSEQLAKLLDGKRGWACTQIYARLYALDLKMHMEDQAAIDYWKAKYWWIIRLEEDGRDVAEVRRMAEEFSPMECLSLVRRWDDGCTNGRGPRWAAAEVEVPNGPLK